MYKKITQSAIVLFLTTISSFYVSAQSVSYKKIVDDPYDANNLIIGLQPFYVEAFNGGNFATLGYGAMAQYDFAKIATFEINFRGAYLDLNARNNRTVTGTTILLKPNQNIELGGYFHFIDKEKSKNRRVNLRDNGSSTTFIMVPATVRAVTGLRGGVFRYSFAVGTDYDTEYFVGKNTVTGATDTLSERKLKAYDATGSDVNYYTNMGVNGAYGGITWSRTTNLVIMADRYGKKKNKSKGEFYADVLFAPLITYENFFLKGKGSAYDISSTPEKNIGWRVGYQMLFLSRVGFQFKTEMGQRPGWAGAKGSFYLNFNWGITIGSNLHTKSASAK